MKKHLAPLFLLALVVVAGCRSTRPVPLFSSTKIPPAPDYTDLAAWAAHPAKTDPADRTPCPDVLDEQATAAVDVFYLYPTTYLGGHHREYFWNADIHDAVINGKTDQTAILYQASIFNGAGRVFAPRYRQAHYDVFLTRDKPSAQAALDLAYEDTKIAFRYYLEHWNQGRPFIIAGHSQGARHAMNLLRDLVEGTPLEKQLVATYIVGWPVRANFFKSLQPCQSPEQTDCFCTWRTWERKYGLKKLSANPDSVVCTNPLTWTTDSDRYAPKTANRGAVLRNFCVVFPKLTDAEVHNGYLLCAKPKFPGSILFRRKNYHIADLNLYYFNVRENAQARAKAFLIK